MRLSALRQLFGGILAAFALMGCGSGHPNGPRYPTFSWYVFDIEQGAADRSLAIGCAAAGAGTVAVTLTDVAAAAAPILTTVPCTDGGVSIANVPPGAYYADFDLSGDATIYGDAVTVLDRFRATDPATGVARVFEIGPGRNNDFTATYAPFLVQAFTVSWAIYQQGVQTTCAAVGGDFVYLDFLVAGMATWVSSPLDCATGSGYSYAIPVADAGATLGSTAQWRLSLTRARTDLQVIDGGSIALPTNTNVNLAPQYFSF